MKAIRPSVLEQELIQNIEAGIPVMIWGPPGVGKSDMVRAVAKKQNRPHVDLRANLLDPTDLRGFPYISKDGRACWAPPSFLPDPARGEGRALLNIEEVPTAMPSTQTALYQLVLDYRIGEYVLPPEVAIIATGNRQTDRAATYNMPTPLKNRFAHYLLEPNLDDWCIWAINNNIDPLVISFLRFKPALLFQFDPNVEAFPTPRTWAKLSQRMPHTASDSVFYAAASLVGEGPGGEFTAFCKIYRELPDLDEVVKNPDKVPVPKDSPATCYAICGALSAKATRGNIGNILKYTGRMTPEFQVLFAKETLTRDPKIVMVPEFQTWAQKNANVIL